MEQGRVVGANTGQIHVTKLNERDLLDYRAIQRTFDGAYARTALGQLCYAIVILRLFQAKFFYVGMVYAILGIGFIPVAVIRYRMAASNAHQYHELNTLPCQGSSSSTAQNTLSSNPAMVAHSGSVLNKSFVTAGSVVAIATVFVFLVEAALLVLILQV